MAENCPFQKATDQPRCDYQPHAAAIIQTYYRSRLKGSAFSFPVPSSTFRWGTYLVAVEGGSSLGSRNLDSATIGQGSDQPDAQKRTFWGFPLTLLVFFGVEAPRRNRVSFSSGAAFLAQRGLSNCTANPAVCGLRERGQLLAFFIPAFLYF